MTRALILIAVLLTGHPGVPVAADTPPPSGAGVTVLSLNVAMQEDVEAIADGLARLGGLAADVILLQEVIQPEHGRDVASRLAERLGWSSAYGPAFEAGGGRRAGLALLTRHPLRDPRILPLRRFDLSFRSRQRIALAAAVDTPAGPLQVVNVHLDTRINLPDRIDQLQTVIDAVQPLAGAVIVGGDFNSNDNRWLFHTIPLPFVGRQAAGLLAHMEGLGFRSAFGRGHPTHDVLGMQLDWVFMRGLRPSGGVIVPTTLSDHHAVSVAAVADAAVQPSR